MVSTDPDERMPQNRDALALPQLEQVRRWIQEGVPYDGDDPDANLVAIIPPATYFAAPESYRFAVPITAMVFSPDGHELVVGGYHELTVWDVATQKLVRRIPNLGQRTYGLAQSPVTGLLAVGGGEPGVLGEIRMVDFADGTILQALGATTDVVTDVAWRPDGKPLAVAAADNTLRIFGLAEGKLIHTLTSHSDWVMAIAWSDDGKQLATASRDKSVKVFDAESGKLRITYSGHDQPVYSVAFHPSGQEVYSGGDDNKLHRWKIADGKRLADIAFGGTVTEVLAVDPFLFAAAADKSVRQFTRDNLKPLRTFDGHNDEVLSIAYHAASKQLATGGIDGEVIVWNADNGSQLGRFHAAPGYVADGK